MRSVLILLPLILVACSQEQEGEAEHHNHAATRPEQQAAGPAATSPAVTGSPIAAMPAALQGRWGITANDCDPARSDAKGLMVVTADSLRFYESRGTLRSAETIGPDAVQATFAYTGEGMEWTAQDTFRLINDGQVLVRRATGAEPTEPLEYRRCQ